MRLTATTIPDAEGPPTCEQEGHMGWLTISLFTETVPDLLLRQQPELKTLVYVLGIPDFTTVLTNMHMCTSAQVIVCIDANFAQ